MIYRLVLLTLALITASSALADERKHIVLIAGKKSHGPEGNRIHDYPWSVKLLRTMLENSNISEMVRVTTFRDGWPKDEHALDDADTVLIISDGRDGDKFAEAPHLENAKRVARVEKLVRRGCGIATFHFSTFAPDQYAKQALDWYGAYFDWETDGMRKWYSAIKTVEADIEVSSPKHPVNRGVEPFRMREEFYYNMRFHPDDDGTTKLWTVPALAGRAANGNVVAWARQRADGGRGFGSTCGHFYDNWKHDGLRKLVLNALAWTAKIEVPKDGVTARFFTHKEITDHLASRETIRALILTGHQYPGHPWRETTPVLRAALKQDDRYRVDISTDIEDLSRKNLRDYDALVLNYCNWKQPGGLSEASKKAFVSYLKNGGGLTLVHFSNGAWHFSLPEAKASDWPEFRKICRRVWDHDSDSGHDAYGEFRVLIEDSASGSGHGASEITRGMTSFVTHDELYFRQKGDAPIRALVSARSKITGKNEPLAWAYRYGKGRVFQTVLGHDARSLRYAGVAQLIRRGSTWAAGAAQQDLGPQQIDAKHERPIDSLTNRP